MKFITSLFVLAVISGFASADITVLYDITMPNVPGGCQPGGVEWTVTRFQITTAVDWVSAELIVTPTEPNQIHQYWYDWHGGRIDNDISISSVDILYDGNAAVYDTFITDELLIDGTAASAFSWQSPTADPNDLVYTGAAAESELSMVYSKTTTDDIGTLYLAQVTIKETCNSGTWSFKAYNADSSSVPFYQVSGNIVGGAIPEPASMLVLLGGGVGVFMRRRRK